jgi:CRP/FNR family cyclic AMP-dependent transcriptional regulator
MGPESPVELLMDTYLFQDSNPAQLEALSRGATEVILEPGDHVYRAGDPATHLYVVRSGQLYESVTTAEGDEFVFEMLTRAAVFGEPGLFTPERVRAVNVIAASAAVVVRIARSDLIAFLTRHPPAMLRALEGLAGQVITSVEEAVGLAHLSIELRLCARLLDLAGTHGEDSSEGVRLSLRLNQSTLAASIGASRENVNRALARLSADGLVALAEGSVILTDPEGLRRRLGDWPSSSKRNRRR